MAITLSDIDATLKNIKGATDEARKVIGGIRTVDRVIRIASAATVLGSALANGNSNGITDAVRALYDEASSAKQGGLIRGFGSRTSRNRAALSNAGTSRYCDRLHSADGSQVQFPARHAWT